MIRSHLCSGMSLVVEIVWTLEVLHVHIYAGMSVVDVAELDLAAIGSPVTDSCERRYVETRPRCHSLGRMRRYTTA